MKTSIRISVAIIAAVLLTLLYRAAGNPINGFNACVLLGFIAVGGLLGQSQAQVNDKKQKGHRL